MHLWLNLLGVRQLSIADCEKGAFCFLLQSNTLWNWQPAINCCVAFYQTAAGGGKISGDNSSGIERTLDSISDDQNVNLGLDLLGMGH